MGSVCCLKEELPLETREIGIINKKRSRESVLESSLNIAVIGAGIGGLAAALCLEKKGFKITIFEKSDLTGELGAGIQLSPNPLKILFNLGIEHSLRYHAFMPEFISIRDWEKGRLIMETPLNPESQQSYGYPYLHIHRADLINVMLGSIKDKSLISLRTMSEVLEVNEMASKCIVTLKTGSKQSFDLVIGADGINSQVAFNLDSEVKPKYSGNVAWRALVPRSNLSDDLIHENASLWLGPRKHFVHYKVRKGDLVNCIGISESYGWRKESWIEKADIEEFKVEFNGWDPRLRKLIESVDQTTVYKWALYRRPMIKKWHTDRQVLLGDSCHAILPFLAQGAALAIEDAAVLANCLSEEQDIKNAFSSYQRLRERRVSWVQFMSNANAHSFHCSEQLAPLRNFLLKRFSGPALDRLYRYEAMSQGLTP